MGFQRPRPAEVASIGRPAGGPAGPERQDAPSMLTTKQKTLRRFWYATAKIEDLKNGPQPFRLLGEDLVLFLDAEGHPAALADRCCHRTAKLRSETRRVGKECVRTCRSRGSRAQ